MATPPRLTLQLVSALCEGVSRWPASPELASPSLGRSSLGQHAARQLLREVARRVWLVGSQSSSCCLTGASRQGQQKRPLCPVCPWEGAARVSMWRPLTQRSFWAPSSLGRRGRGETGTRPAALWVPRFKWLPWLVRRRLDECTGMYVFLTWPVILTGDFQFVFNENPQTYQSRGSSRSPQPSPRFRVKVFPILPLSITLFKSLFSPPLFFFLPTFQTLFCPYLLHVCRFKNQTVVGFASRLARTRALSA